MITVVAWGSPARDELSPPKDGPGHAEASDSLRNKRVEFRGKNESQRFESLTGRKTRLKMEEVH
jgi:hypothetical protein